MTFPGNCRKVGNVFPAGAAAHAELRPIQNIVAPGEQGETPLFLRLRLRSR